MRSPRHAPTLALAWTLLASAVVSAAPPKLDIPTEIRASGQYVDFDPVTDAVSVEYVGLSGVDPVPSGRLADKKAFLLDTRGLAAARYEFVAVAAGQGGDQVKRRFAVVVGDVLLPPIPVKPPVQPPPPMPVNPPPADPAAGYYFLIVRPDGPASAAFTRVMADLAWAKLTADGHTFKDKTATEAAALGVVVPADKLPAVVTLSVQGGKSTIVRPAVALPTTSAGILELPKGVK